MNINAGDMLKWYKNKKSYGIAVVTRTYGDNFDLLWLQAKGFQANNSTSSCYQMSLLSQSLGWSKIS